MSLQTISKKRNRIYQRKFDHEEAQRLHAGGATYAALAEHYGVCYETLRRVCDPAVREKLDRASREYMYRKYRKECLGGCGRFVWNQPGHNRSGYCRRCLKKKVDADRADVGDGILRCFRCDEWKPDDEFPTYRPVKARRDHNSWCRSCCAAARREHRAAHPEATRVIHRRAYRKRQERKGRDMQKYIVLEPNGDNSYREIQRVEAASPAHAVEQVAGRAGTFFAVTETKFKPLRVEPVSEFRVMPMLSEAADTKAA